jgi:hypothetical protein
MLNTHSKFLRKLSQKRIFLEIPLVVSEINVKKWTATDPCVL